MREEYKNFKAKKTFGRADRDFSAVALVGKES